jgi:hypothetical protein
MFNVNYCNCCFVECTLNFVNKRNLVNLKFPSIKHYGKQLSVLWRNGNSKFFKFFQLSRPEVLIMY